MMTGFLEGHQANGAFVAVGPPGRYHDPRGKAHADHQNLGFTALALIKLGGHAREMYVAFYLRLSRNVAFG